ncbi:unnamed protein product [Cylindrotheca closterium]|uniref:Uncharacterized protein n=1 Tax=Cylindrotheca closterium TaxID=2856 RepID=A0AAD2CCF8_9STRA|nr:unnamed protein product [Cylindrotheca closterium]
MGNLLTPRRRDSYSQSGSARTPHSLHDPMPNQIGAWIKTERGVRRLMKEEVARGLGIPKGCKTELSHKSLQRTTSLFHWEYLFFLLQHLFSHPTHTPGKTTQGPKTGNHLSGATTTLDNDVFNWHPPNLSSGSPWHTLRLANLRWAADHYPEPDNIYWDAAQRLAVHRNNYNSEGPDPKRLQLSW